AVEGGQHGRNIDHAGVIDPAADGVLRVLADGAGTVDLRAQPVPLPLHARHVPEPGSGEGLGDVSNEHTARRPVERGRVVAAVADRAVLRVYAPRRAPPALGHHLGHARRGHHATPPTSATVTVTPVPPASGRRTV